MSTAPSQVRADRLEAFNQKLRDNGLTGYWMRPATVQSGTDKEPRLLRWADVYPLLLEAGEVVRLGDDTFRRNIGGFQVVMPGEKAPAHQHTSSAMRFVVVGDGSAYTTTNGEQMFMRPGDLLVQPNFGWHDHTNLGQEPVIWMDMLDTALVNLVEGMFRGEWAEGEVQPVTKPEGYHSRAYGLLRPTRLTRTRDPFVPVTYKFTDTLPVLESLADGDGDPYDGVLLEYTNPATRGHTLPTMSARIQMLRPGEATRAHRHTGTVRYHAVRGQGVTTVDLNDPTELTWGEKDTFWIPSWRWHQHRNLSADEPAILFTITDSPIAEAFGLYKEEGR